MLGMIMNKKTANPHPTMIMNEQTASSHPTRFVPVDNPPTLVPGNHTPGAPAAAQTNVECGRCYHSYIRGRKFFYTKTFLYVLVMALML